MVELRQVGTRVRHAKDALKSYVEERKEIAKWLAKQAESSLRTGKPVVFELEGISFPPVSLSAEIGEERRKRIREARYRALSNFKVFTSFTERRIIR